VGTTALMLDLVEEEAVPWLVLADPVRAMHTVSLDTRLQVPVRLEDGRWLRALDIQRMFWQAAQRFHGRDSETDWVLREWHETLARLEADPLSLADRLDWVAKLALIQQVHGDVPTWEDHSVRRIDLGYHLLNPHRNIYHALVSAGRMRRLLTDADIQRALPVPRYVLRA